jgi:hypothetical protein
MCADRGTKRSDAEPTATTKISRDVAERCETRHFPILIDTDRIHAGTTDNGNADAICSCHAKPGL